MGNTWRIGEIEFSNRVVCAPLAGISNPAFRSVLKGFNPGLMYTEMISDKALLYQNQKTYKMLEVSPQENPVSLQLFGSDPDEMAGACRIACENSQAVIIDINMGCPMLKIVRQGSGSSLMKDVDRACEIVRKMKQVSDRPVTVKIRSGWDNQSINAVEMAKALENAGVDAIAVHGRTRSQFYDGEADWDIIKAVKENVSIPVIGNGDIKTVYDAKDMLEKTGCDAIMVGRGMLGRPWFIQQIVTYLETGEILPDPDYQQRFDICKKQAEALVSEFGEVNGMKMMRSHACWYVQGLRNCTAVKYELSRIKTYKEMVEILDRYTEELNAIIEK